MDEMWVVLGLLAVALLLAVPVLLVMALVSVSALKRRVAALEEAFAHRAGESEATAAVSPRAAAVVEPVVVMEDAGPAVPAPEMPAPAAVAPPPPLPPLPERPARPAVARAEPEYRQRAAWTPPEPPEPNFVERGVERIKHWFTSGNVPIKVGMLVMLAGVAALLKYASDAGWLTVPMELRLAGISAAALAGLVFAWRRRESHRSFALAVQGGMIGILLLVVFAAFKNHGMIDALPAFAISVVLIAGLCVMAVLQESRTLAILGVLAGFMAPIWLSDGSGNHVGLFSYYAVLNAGIFAIAWVRPWRVLNLLGFVFTWGIGTAWGVLDYEPAHFASTEPFLLLFFVFYLLLPLLYARKAATEGSARIDGCLLFGTPLVAFSLQAGLLQGERMPLALCALGVAALYAVLARLLLRRERLHLLAQGYAILAVGFATLAVPLALSARVTASVFALEGAGLVWLGLMQQRRLARWTGIGLQLAAAFAFAIGVAGMHGGAVAVANAVFMGALLIAFGVVDILFKQVAKAGAAFSGALLIALAGFVSAWLYRNAGNVPLAVVAYGWGLAWWLGNVATEIERFIEPDSRLHGLLLLPGVTGWLAAEVHRRRPALALSLTTLGGLLLAFPLAFMQVARDGQPFAGIGAWAWLLFAVLGVRSLLCLRVAGNAVAGLAQLAWWLLWPTVFSLLAWHVGRHFELAGGWVGMLLALPWLLLAWLSMRRWHWLAQPLGDAFDRYRTAMQATVFAVLGMWWLLSLDNPAAAAPLPWVALLNPLELVQVAVLVLAAMRLWRGRDEHTPPWLWVGAALAALVLVTVMTLRAVHHWGGEPWNEGLLDTRLAQTSLTVVWSLLGVLGWVTGSRRGQWGLWLAGAILMGVVLAKLLLIDRGNLGDLLGIGAFIAYGLLCTLVGWLAPAPPRRAPATVDNEETSA
ncbi:Membrane protein [uncultured Stenotrophomonas sp.]|uniref:Membrane protein n=1 Tax=uncultured Stenotrophomonas sp. TaxID=165438 RepID=A0A1Y5Q7H2_9GAMM|nr:Membrane protein [uncultured Stenotrophomonas sp.]